MTNDKEMRDSENELENAVWHIDEAMEMLVDTGARPFSERGDDKEDRDLYERALRNIELAGQALEAYQQSCAGVEGWMPIETAPRDGTRIVTATFDEPISYCAIAYTYNREKWLISQTERLPYMPTHWMPLPDAPTPPTEKGE